MSNTVFSINSFVKFRISITSRKILSAFSFPFAISHVSLCQIIYLIGQPTETSIQTLSEIESHCNCHPVHISGEDRFDNFAADISQAHVPPHKAIGKFFVIKAKEMKDRSV